MAHVFVTGGTGFVGMEVVDELLTRGHGVTALLRGEPPPAWAGRVQTVWGDVFDAAALEAGMKSCDAVVHLVGIIAERPRAGVTFDRIHVGGTAAVLEAARRAGVRRYVHMSALGMRPSAASEYHRTKFDAEERVAASGLDYTIFRPSMIHGLRGEFTRMQAAWARRSAVPYLFMPYFGKGVLGLGGGGKLQPVYVGDVARAFVDAIEMPATAGQTFELAGPDVLTWPEMHRAVARAVVGRARLVMPMPAWYATLLARITPASLLPFNRDQVVMSQEDNTADLAPFVAAFGWTPRPFLETLESYAGRIGGDGVQ